jgi:hypothetical protein
MSKEVKQGILLAVLGIGLLAAIYMMFFKEDPEHAAYMANLEASKAGQPAAATTPTPAATTPTAGAPTAAPTASSTGLTIASANVDVDALLARVKEVDFNYDDERLAVDPFRPLVGPLAPARLQGAEIGETAVGSRDVNYVLRNMRVTGIMWNQFRPLAVVNDEVVHPGYVFEETGVMVETIENNRVMVRLGDALVPIELEER